jgi:hypothetical protein
MDVEASEDERHGDERHADERHADERRRDPATDGSPLRPSVLDRRDVARPVRAYRPFAKQRLREFEEWRRFAKLAPAPGARDERASGGLESVE